MQTQYTLTQIIKAELLVGRNGPYTSVAVVSNLIKRKQLKAKKGVSIHGPCWIVSRDEINRYNKERTD